MTGRPQREEPKETIRLTIGKDVYASMLPLLKNDTVTFASMSQLVETIIFLSEHIYIAEPDDSFVIGLAGIRGRQDHRANRGSRAHDDASRARLARRAGNWIP